MIPVSVRPAVERDRNALAQVMLDAFRANYESFMPQAYIDAWHATEVAHCTVGRGIDRTGVAEIDGTIRGFATTEDDFLSELWVCPTMQGQGVGSTLVRWAEEKLILAGHQTMSLYCYGDNVQALAFYDKLGFRVVKTFSSRHVAGGPVPVCILAKETGEPKA